MMMMQKIMTEIAKHKAINIFDLFLRENKCVGINMNRQDLRRTEVIGRERERQENRRKDYLEVRETTWASSIIFMSDLEPIVSSSLIFVVLLLFSIRENRKQHKLIPPFHLLSSHLNLVNLSFSFAAAKHQRGPPLVVNLFLTSPASSQI